MVIGSRGVRVSYLSRVKTHELLDSDLTLRDEEVTGRPAIFFASV